MIFGVTGNYASGKDTVAEFLHEMNFRHVSFSDLLREELKTRNVDLTRDNLINVGNELRQKFGADILAKKALAKLEDGENFVFTSIRNPAEVKSLEQRKDFILVEVIAPEKTRLSRLLSRNRLGDPKTLDELQQKESLENSSSATDQQLKKVSELARIVLKNDSTLDNLKQKTEQMVNDWMFKLQDSRPSWDEYFMQIADAAKMRANCMSAKKAAVIVKNKQIVSTGYCGSPKGTKHCNEGGCERCTLRHLGKIKTGVYSSPCVCSHAEENAIVQAACNGISTKGAKIFTTFTPCTACCKMIINAGIVEVIAKVKYADDVGTKLLKEANVMLRVL